MPNDVFTPTGDNDGSVLDALVGQGKKFADSEALAKGKQEADVFIEQLKEEKRIALEELEKVSKEKGTEYTIADLVKAVKDSSAGTGNEGEGTPAQTPEDLQELIKNVMTGEKAQATADANRSMGNELVLQKVGGNVEAAAALVAERAKSLGLTPSKLAELSEQSPDAFAKVMGLDTNNVAPQGTAGLPNTNTNFQSGGAVMEIDGHKTKAWFDAQRKEMGTRKYLNNNQLQNQLMKASLALGPRFY